MFYRRAIGFVGGYASSYLRLIENSNIPDIEQHHLVVQIKRNLDNMIDTSPQKTTRKKLADLSKKTKTLMQKQKALQKLVESSVFSSDEAVVEAAQKIRLLFTCKISEFNRKPLAERIYCIRAQLNRLDMEENKAAVAVLNFQLNVDAISDSMNEYTRTYRDYIDYCTNSRKVSRAGYHKSLLAANIRSFNRLVAVKSEEPDGELWLLLKRYIELNKKTFYTIYSSGKNTPDRPDDIESSDNSETDSIDSLTE